MIKQFTAGSVIGIIVLSVLLISCSRKNEVEEIRKMFAQCVQLAKAHETQKIIDHVTEDFVAMPGDHDRRTTKRILWISFRHYDKFTIKYPQPDIEIGKDGQTARATITLLILKQGQIMPDIDELYKDPGRWVQKVGEKADLYRLKVELVKTSGDWKAKQARLEPFRGTGFRS